MKIRIIIGLCAFLMSFTDYQQGIGGGFSELYERLTRNSIKLNDSKEAINSEKRSLSEISIIKFWTNIGNDTFEYILYFHIDNNKNADSMIFSYNENEIHVRFIPLGQNTSLCPLSFSEIEEDKLVFNYSSNFRYGQRKEFYFNDDYYIMINTKCIFSFSRYELYTSYLVLLKFEKSNSMPSILIIPNDFHSPFDFDHLIVSDFNNDSNLDFLLTSSSEETDLGQWNVVLNVFTLQDDTLKKLKDKNGEYYQIEYNCKEDKLNFIDYKIINWFD